MTGYTTSGSVQWAKQGQQSLEDLGRKIHEKVAGLELWAGIAR